VLDTNAVSETRKPRPNPGFLAWLHARDPAQLFISTISLAEVWHGFHGLPPNHADYHSIKRFATGLPLKYRVLNFDARAAITSGEMTGTGAGPFPLRDSLIAAIVRSRGYRVVTRDTAPFERLGWKVIAPWI